MPHCGGFQELDFNTKIIFWAGLVKSAKNLGFKYQKMEGKDQLLTTDL